KITRRHTSHIRLSRLSAPLTLDTPTTSRRATRSSRTSPTASLGKSTAAYASAVLTIRPLHPEDWLAVEAIWAEGIDTRNATFETETPSWSSFDASRHPDHRHVALLDDLVVGWATLSPVSRRPCYTGVAENSV